MNNKGESTRGISDQVSPIIFRRPPSFIFGVSRPGGNDYTMSGFGKFSTIRYRFRPRRDAPSWIHRVSRSTPLSVPPPPPPSILRFSQGFTVMPRNKTRRPPLIRITPENPRNCTVARYYRARKNGIRARFRHSFTVFTLSIPPPRIFDPSIAPLLPSISIFPLRKSIIET